MQKFRKHLSYANVMATVAVFLALGGGAYASLHLGKNSVGVRQLKANAVSTKKLQNGAVTSTKIAKHAVGGAKIANGSIGPAEVSNSLHLLCASGTTYVQGACVDSESSGTDLQTWSTSQASCKNRGGRLPSPSELFTLAARGGFFSGILDEWTNSIGSDGTAFKAQIVRSSASAGTASLDISLPYRCVFDPTG